MRWSHWKSWHHTVWILALLPSCLWFPPQPQKPQATNLTATAVSSTKVKLQWTLESGGQSVSIYQDTGDGLKYYAYASLTEFVAENLEPATTYTFSVLSYQTATTIDVNAGPKITVNTLGLANPVLQTKYIKDNSVVLDSDVIEGAEKTILERRQGTGEFQTVTGVAGNTRFVDSTVLPNTSYQYRLRATSKKSSSQSNEVNITTLAPLDPLTVALLPPVDFPSSARAGSFIFQVNVTGQPDQVSFVVANRINGSRVVNAVLQPPFSYTLNVASLPTGDYSIAAYAGRFDDLVGSDIKFLTVQ